MSGEYSRLQARILKCNKYASYFPSAGHSLNLVGSKAAEKVKATVAFFYFVQNVYTYFSASMHRWNILLQATNGKVLKSLSETRWSARADATRALYHSYVKILQALVEISESETLPKETKYEAKCLMKQMKQFRHLFLATVWYEI